MQLAVNEIASVLGCPAPPCADRTVTGYSIDSRTIQTGELFFAVRGQRLDGHDYVQSALERGAAAAVVAEARKGEFRQECQPKLLAVQDPLAALQTLAAEVRRRWGGPVVAITGSSGKTTTKQMISSLLRTRFQVLENTGNLNNQFGLPLSLLRLEPSTEIGVFEMGMSGPGEIRLLASLARPDVGVVTNVSAAHLEFFPNVQAIARAKRELVESLGAADWAVLNADDPRVATFGVQCQGQVLYYGFGDAADLRGSDLHAGKDGGYEFKVSNPSQARSAYGAAWKRPRASIPMTAAAPTQSFNLPLLGRHNVSNVLSALTVCFLFGLLPATVVDAVAGLQPAPRRGETVRLRNGALAVDDCYNSNPAALEAMLYAVVEIPAQRRYAVLGGMMELGPTSETLHFRCGRLAAELGFAGLITVGREARPMALGAIAGGIAVSAVSQCETPEEAGERLRKILEAGDVVLLKASRAVRLEKIWNCLDRPEDSAAKELAAAANLARARQGA